MGSKLGLAFSLQNIVNTLTFSPHTLREREFIHHTHTHSHGVNVAMAICLCEILIHHGLDIYKESDYYLHKINPQLRFIRFLFLL